jgi:hypothetical protein
MRVNRTGIHGNMNDTHSSPASRSHIVPLDDPALSRVATARLADPQT